MKTTIQDDRNKAQKSTHQYAVIATDKFMTGWGGAQGGSSIAGWAFDNSVNSERLFDWVSKRREMKRVRIVNLAKYRPPSTCAHFHIYVTTPSHSAFN